MLICLPWLELCHWIKETLRRLKWIRTITFTLRWAILTVHFLGAKLLISIIKESGTKDIRRKSEKSHERFAWSSKKPNLNLKGLPCFVINLNLIRCGNFKRIYPNENVFYYKPFFEQDRYFNKVLRQKFCYNFYF